MTRFKIVTKKHNDTHMLLENLIKEREEFQEKSGKSIISCMHYLSFCTVFQKLINIPDIFNKTLSYYQSMRVINQLLKILFKGISLGRNWEKFTIYG